MNYKLSIPTVLCLCFSAIAGLTSSQIERGACLTPDSKPSICVPVSQCQPILEFIRKSSKPLSAKTIQELRKYQCPRTGVTKTKGSVVCCPHESINIRKDQKEIEYKSAPDVTNHKNVKLIPNKCGIFGTYSNIVNGEIAGLFEFPWMALLVYNTSGGIKFSCGGTIINDKYILTAAHCITPELINVRVGEYDVRTDIDCDNEGKTPTCAEPFQNLLIEETIPHESYDDIDKFNDIALIRVSKMNTSGENVQAICLPLREGRNYNFSSRSLTVAGWGIIDDIGTESPVLRKVDVPVIPLEDCKDKFSHLVELSYRQVCAGGSDRKDSCVGDSGGPLHGVGVYNGDPRYIQQGIVSFGPKPCGGRRPAVYTKVAHYMDWILDHMRP